MCSGVDPEEVSPLPALWIRPWCSDSIHDCLQSATGPNFMAPLNVEFCAYTLLWQINVRTLQGAISTEVCGKHHLEINSTDDVMVFSLQKNGKLLCLCTAVGNAVLSYSTVINKQCDKQTIMSSVHMSI